MPKGLEESHFKGMSKLIQDLLTVYLFIPSIQKFLLILNE